MTQVSARVLIAGIEEASEVHLKDFLSRCQVMRLPYDLEQLMTPMTPGPDIVLCGPPPAGLPAPEVAQLMRAQFPNSPIYFLTTNRDNYDVKSYVKNGFTDVFLIPMDVPVMDQALREFLAMISNGAIKTYRSVKLVDMDPGTVLDFDTSIYLPMNKKYIRFSSSGTPLDDERASRLKKQNFSNVFISSDQISQFYAFSAKRLKEISNSSALSETERQEKLQTSVRNLMSGLFSETGKEATFDQGQSFTKDCQEIVNSFVLGSSSDDWYQKILSAMGEMGNAYNHAGNTSTFATLFAVGIGLKNVTEIALAGLLHDIGLVMVPAPILEKKEEDRSEEEQAIYQKHPEYSIEIAKSRKLILPEVVMKAIAQHHECYSGSGYPRKVSGDRICKEAQIIALADRFDDLTTIVEGRPRMTPSQALNTIMHQAADGSGGLIFDPNLLNSVLKLFPV